MPDNVIAKTSQTTTSTPTRSPETPQDIRNFRAKLKKFKLGARSSGLQTPVDKPEADYFEKQESVPNSPPAKSALTVQIERAKASDSSYQPTSSAPPPASDSFQVGWFNENQENGCTIL